MRIIKVIATLALAAGVMGANAQMSTNATPNGSHVIQGNFENGTSPDVFLQDNGNSKRVGVGGATGNRRVNAPIWGLDLPPIPPGESLTVATLSVPVELIAGSPMFFDVVASLMNATSLGAITAADFVEATAPVDSVLSNGVVFAQITEAGIPSSGMWEIPMKGAALTQLNSLYVAGNPTQSTVWFRLSPSVSTTYAAGQGDRVQFLDDGSGSAAAFGLKLSWAPVPDFIADPVVKANVTWGSDYAALSQTLDGSATSSDGISTIYYEKTGGPDWLVVATNGALSGVADVVGTNEFPVKAIIGENFDIAILQIVVDPLGNPPEFSTNVITKAGGTYDEDYALQSQTLAGSATDPDGDTLIYSRAGGGPGWLNVASNGALSGVCDVLGTNTFPIQVTDGNGNSDTASLVIYVQMVGSPPAFTTNVIEKADGVVGEDYVFQLQTLDGSATDPDGDTLIYSKTGGPAWLIVASNGALSGVCTVEGTNSFDVQVDDGNGNSDTAELLIFVAPKPVGALIVGMDEFSSSGSPGVTFMAAGIIANATASAYNIAGGATSTVFWAINDSGSDPGRGSSDDATWGTHEGPPAASTNTTTGPANFSLTNAKSYGQVTFTISNTGTEDLELGAFHFDALAFRPKAARTWAVNVLDGSDITVGNVYTSGLPMNDNSTDAITHLGGGLSGHDQHDDINLDLTGLADHTLEAGGTLIIQLEFSNGVGDNAGGHHLFLDNIGLSLKGESTSVPTSPVMSIEVSGSDVIVSWLSAAEWKLQGSESLTGGSWTDITGYTNSPVTVPATKAAEFMRLFWEL